MLHRTQRSHGFTMIEIIIVIVIVLMLVSMSMPRLKGTYQMAQIRRSCRDVTALLRLARDSAVLRELPTEVRFSPDTDQYQFVLLDEYFERVDLKDFEREQKRERGAKLSVGRELLNIRELPSGVHFDVIYASADLTPDTDLPRVVFYPDGSSSPATISIADEHKHNLSVEVFRTTGLSRVMKGLPDIDEKNSRQRLQYKSNRR